MPGLKSYLLRLSSSTGNLRFVLVAPRDIDVRPLLPRIEPPVLILHRRDARSAPVKASRYLAKELSRHTEQELEGRDHWWWVSDTDAIIEKVEGFVNDIIQTG